MAGRAGFGHTRSRGSCGYLLAYRNNLRLNQRKDRLDRITRQLGDLYGPLYALASSSAAAWLVFRSQYRPGGAFWSSFRSAPTEDEAAAWRRWMTTVFMPLNRRLREAIVEHIDLLEEEVVPQVLLDACAHVASYEAVLQRWEEGDYTEHTEQRSFCGHIELLADRGRRVETAACSCAAAVISRRSPSPWLARPLSLGRSDSAHGGRVGRGLRPERNPSSTFWLVYGREGEGALTSAE